MKTYNLIRTAAWLAVSLHIPIAAMAADKTWTGSASSDWYAAGNWSPPGAPDPVDNLTLNSGTVNISPPFTVSNRLTWNGGTINGSLNVAVPGQLVISGSAEKYFFGPLTNAGLVQLSGSGGLTVMGGGYNGRLENLPGAMFEFQADVLIWGQLGPPPVFNNAGTVRKSGGSGVAAIGANYVSTPYPVAFTNSGLVEALSGTLELRGGGLVNGTFNTAAGAGINLASGGFFHSAVGSMTITGPGQTRLAGGVLTLHEVVANLQLAWGAVWLAPDFQRGTITNLTLLSVTLLGTNTVTGSLMLSNGFNGALTVAGGAALDWQGGDGQGSVTVASQGRATWSKSTLTGWIMVAANGQFTVAGSTDKWLAGPLTNAGLVELSGGSLMLVGNSGGRVENLAGAVFEFQADVVIWGQSGAWFRNAGTVLKSGGSGVAAIGANYVSTPYWVAFTNSGLVAAFSGTLELRGGGLVNGTFNTAAGAGINLASGGFFHSAVGSMTITGPGQTRLAGGVLTLHEVIPNLQLASGAVWLAADFQGGTITNLTLLGVTLLGTNTVTGSLTLSNGFNGPLTVASGAGLDWQGGDAQGSLTVASQGRATWSKSTLTGWIMAAANGQLAIGGSTDKYLYGSLTNAGLVQLGGTGSLTLMGGGYNGRVENLAAAVFEIQTDVLIYGQSWPYPVFNNAGTVRKSGGSGVAAIGANYVSTPYPVAFTNRGLVEAWSGILRFNTYSETPSANLSVSLGGTAPSAYGHLDFVNAPTFIGQFTVRTHNGFRPNPGDSFVVLSYPSATAAFTCLNGLDLGGGILLVPTFEPTKLTLTATTYTVTDRPPLFISQAPGAVRITWPLGFPGWKLLATTNLTTPLWVEMPVQCGNDASVPISGKQMYFRLAQQ